MENDHTSASFLLVFIEFRSVFASIEKLYVDRVEGFCFLSHLCLAGTVPCPIIFSFLFFPFFFFGGGGFCYAYLL